MDGRNSHWLRCVLPDVVCCLVASQATRWLCALALHRHLLRYHVDEIAVWAHVLVLVVLLCCEPPTASSPFGSTGVLWVSTTTHPYDDPPRQGGEPSESELVPCAVASAVLSREKS